MTRPAEIEAAAARHQAFQLHIGATSVLMVAIFVAALLLGDVLGKSGVVGLMAAGTVPMLAVALAGLKRGVLRDAELVAAWQHREADRLARQVRGATEHGVEDERWVEVGPLLARLRELLVASDRSVVDRAESHLRQVSADLRLFDEALNALEGASADGQHDRLKAARADADQEWSTTLALLRDLHVEVSARDREGGALAALDDLVRHAAADAEVEAAERRVLARRATQRGRQRQ